MAAYVKLTNFLSKDSLLTGNPDKVVTGSELDAEFNAIALSSSQNVTAITDSTTAAAASATAAASSATSASTSATTATTQATNAAASASTASTQATNASNSAASASSSASTATTQASNASTSASSAAASASTATTQASNASTYASNASTSASNAATSETNAATSASNASTSASSASTSASTATTQASNASTSASNASTSASNAATSASNASTSASNAATSETNAAASEVAAAASATALTGTSTTSLTPSLAEKVVTTQGSKEFAAGTFIEMVSASDAAVWMFGPVTSYTGTTLTFTPTVIGTASAKADWTIYGRVGARGATGATGAGLTDQATGFTATGGTTPKTLTVDDDMTTSQAARRNADNTLSGTQTMSGKSVIEANASVAAHATTMNPWLGGNYVTLTGGAVTFTALANAPQAGAEVELYMNAAHVFTDGAVFEVDGNANYTAAIGDRVLLRAKSTTVFTVHPRKADGTPVVAGGSGALVYLSTVTAAAAATVDVETGFGTTYDDYMVVANFTTSAGDTISSLLKFAGAYDTGTNYLSVTSVAGVEDTGKAAQADMSIIAGIAQSYTIHLLGTNSGSICNGLAHITERSATPGIAQVVRSFCNTANTTALQGIRFQTDGAATITGTFKLYGIAKA